jgi:hypothetical protein
MRKSFLAALVLTVSVGVGAAAANAQTTACKAASAWDATGKCVPCKELVTDAKALKACSACKAGTAFNVAGGRCVKLTVKKS